MVANVQLSSPDFRYPYPGIFTASALSASLSGFWIFNQAPGETEEESAQRCSWNLAPGASNAAIDRRWISGIPTFEATYARFPNGKPLVTNLPDWTTAGGAVFMIARTVDTGIVDTNTRSFVCGTYGGNTNFGNGFEFAAVSTSQARSIDYNAAGTVQVNTIDMGTVATDLEKWRLYYYASGATLQARNLNPADGTTPTPTATTLTGNRRVGSQTFSIGGRISDSGTNYDPLIHKDIACVARFDAIPDAGQLSTLSAQMAAVATSLGITLGAA